MNCAFPIPDSVAALTSSRATRLHPAELSIVSILDGKIGDPVTWIDEPVSGGPDGCTSGRIAEPFKAVADDIDAHLPTGVVLVHRPDSALALLPQVLPAWRPALIVDALALAEYAQTSANRRHKTRQAAAALDAEIGRATTGERAVAIARFLIDLVDSPACLLG